MIFRGVANVDKNMNALLFMLVVSAPQKAMPGVVGQAQTSPKAGELVSKMLKLYSDAKTVTGTIVYTARVNSESVQLETVLQLKRPDKLYISQKHKAKTYLVVADGTNFSYDPPLELPSRPGDRLTESMTQGAAKIDLRAVYAAASHSIVDRNIPLDIAISRLEDLKYMKNQWATLDFAPQQPSGTVKRYVITGNWRAYGDAPISGTYEFWIDESGELKRYVQTEIVQPEKSVKPLQVVSTWDVSLTIDGKVDEALFKLP